MNSDLFLQWAPMAVSLFNTILPVWLGLTVLLNAEKRTLGIWMAGGGLLMGAFFFLSHTIILAQGGELYNPGVNFWWHAGWIPVILAPFAWYGVMLWYTGYWEEVGSPLNRRHRPWLILISTFTSILLLLLVFRNPLPSFSQVIRLELVASPSLAGIPMLILFYPLYILLCIGLSLDALLIPGPTLRVMGHLARQRARPWLVASSIILLLVSLLVGGVMLWVVLKAPSLFFGPQMGRAVSWLDLAIATLIAAAIVATGQAIVSYEVFTGKTLPRRGLMRYWQRALILAGGYSLIISFSLALDIQPIYSLLLGAGLMVIFYALLGWRAYIEREHLITSLRPFIESTHLYEQAQRLVAPAESPGAKDPFHALCKEVLGTRLAFLIPMGSMAPLFGAPLAYPDDQDPPPAKVPELFSQLASSQALCLPLEPLDYGGVSWAVPLWDERGLAGVLLLGEKQDNGLYTQEDLEFARLAGERLVGSQASAEMGRRLLALQRKQMVESQVVDRRARRLLHDEVLPRLHAALLALSASGIKPEREDLNPMTLLEEAHHDIADLIRDIPAASSPEVMKLGLIGALKSQVEGELKNAFDEVTLDIDPLAAQYEEKIPYLTAEALFYAAREVMRNAAKHAVPQSVGDPLRLHIAIEWREGFQIVVEDNGAGFTDPALKTDNGGQGQGLALHSTILAVLGGALSVENAPHAGTLVRMSLPAAHIGLDDSEGSDVSL